MKKLLKSGIAIFTVFALLSSNGYEVQAAAQTEVEHMTLKQSPYQVGNWTINANFAINAPTSYIYGNNEYVSVGSYGTVMKSKDGVNWTALNRFANYQLTAIAWNGENYVMAGANTEYDTYIMGSPSQLFISKDALTWNKVDFKFNDSILYIEYGKGYFVASGLNGVYVSKDGSNWDEVITFTEGYYYHPLQYVNGKFFITAYEQGKVYVSTDGLKWTSLKFDQNKNIVNMIYFNGQYIGVGDGIFKSADGITWSKLSSSPTNTTFQAITTDGKKVVVMGWTGSQSHQVAYVSENLSSWTKQDLSSFGHEIYGIYPVKDGFAGLAYKENGSIYSMFSKSGVNWTHKLIGNSSLADYQGVAFNGKRAVAVGDLGNIIYTDNGSNWHSATPIANHAEYGRPYFTAIQYGANKFVATSNVGVFTSTDGVTWTQATYFKDKYIMLSELMWTGQYFIASGQTDGVYYSKDGTSWSKVSSVSKDGFWLHSMIYDGKKIVGAFQIYNKGNQYVQLMQTTNGTTWSKLNTLNAMEVELAYNNGTYLAADPYSGSDVWTSKDAKTWSKSSVVKDDELVTIKSFDGYFVAFNRSLQKINGDYIKNTNYYTSKDGKTWKKHNVPARQAEEIFGNEEIKDGIKAFGKYIFVGSQGYILSTTDLQFEDPIFITANGAEIKQSAEAGQAYIEAGVTYLPLRVIGEALKFDIAWNSKEKSVTFNNGVTSATFTGVKIKNGLSYVPLRKVSEQLGYKVDYKKSGSNIYVDIQK